jgi:hypothetical protein
MLNNTSSAVKGAPFMAGNARPQLKLPSGWLNQPPGDREPRLEVNVRPGCASDQAFIDLDDTLDRDVTRGRVRFKGLVRPGVDQRSTLSAHAGPETRMASDSARMTARTCIVPLTG